MVVVALLCVVVAALFGNAMPQHSILPIAGVGFEWVAIWLLYL